MSNDALAAAGGMTHERICPRCGYRRTLIDTAPDGECPECGLVYPRSNPERVAAVKAQLARRQLAAQAGMSGESKVFTLLLLMFVLTPIFPNLPAYMTAALVLALPAMILLTLLLAGLRYLHWALLFALMIDIAPDLLSSLMMFGIVALVLAVFLMFVNLGR